MKREENVDVKQDRFVSLLGARREGKRPGGEEKGYKKGKNPSHSIELLLIRSFHTVTKTLRSLPHHISLLRVHLSNTYTEFSLKRNNDKISDLLGSTLALCQVAIFPG